MQDFFEQGLITPCRTGDWEVDGQVGDKKLKGELFLKMREIG